MTDGGNYGRVQWEFTGQYHDPVDEALPAPVHETTLPAQVELARWRAVPAGKVIHVILDNYGAHKHAKVRRWLTRHPRWIFPFTPTSCSWLNAVVEDFQRFCDQIGEQAKARGLTEEKLVEMLANNR